MHYYGDDWNGWLDLDLACSRLYSLRKWFRLGGQVKEKFGTLRWYVAFHSQIHDLIYPGYVYCQFPYHWMWRVDLQLTYSGKWYTYLYWYTVGRIIRRYQTWGYRYCYKTLVKEFPQIREEILRAADHDHFLRGL